MCKLLLDIEYKIKYKLKIISKRFYEVELYPKNDKCPNGENDCNGCEFCKYTGTLGGEFYVDCKYDD